MVVVERSNNTQSELQKSSLSTYIWLVFTVAKHFPHIPKEFVQKRVLARLDAQHSSKLKLKDGERLVVKDIVKIHNHEVSEVSEVSEASFRHCPRKRQLCPAELTKCSELLTNLENRQEKGDLDVSFCDKWLAQDSDKARFMKSIFNHTMNNVASSAHCFQKETAGPGLVSCNSYAMAAAIDEGFMWVSEPVAVTVELQGTYTRGMMVLDKLGVLEKEHRVFIMKTVDLESFKGLLIDSLK
ncbi:hypothetical protein DPEC_G00152280 [Dallia pectoralis]|uniref:Uncharacterized protein n=1 Tax=Dallia pectoralis TaxID=75939 RepID=A0ACC2GJF5_DALPE|nr:hypothetical protein DPEC_G00152280 [Dallia pectoralis]